VIQHVLFSKRQGLHDGFCLCNVQSVQEENTSRAVFSRVPFADFPINIELDVACISAGMTAMTRSRVTPGFAFSSAKTPVVVDVEV
jgi:hypothetical protein